MLAFVAPLRFTNNVSFCSKSVSPFTDTVTCFAVSPGLNVTVPLDAKPVFITMHLDRKLLAPAVNFHGGIGAVRYRRVLEPEVFFTNWAYVDHLVIPAGASVGRHVHVGVEEFFYVITGQGSARIGEETAAIQKGDAVPVHFNDVHAFENTSAGDLEFLIVGVAREKGRLDVADVK